MDWTHRQKTTGTLDLDAEMDGWIWIFRGISFSNPGFPQNDSSFVFSKRDHPSENSFLDPNE